MPTRKRRITINLDEGTSDLLKWLGDATGLPESGIINRLLGAHMHELWEYRTWLEQLPAGAKKEIGLNFLVSYGPKDLINEIRTFDPSYQFQSEKFNESIKGKTA